jgi:hypothetical protein
MTYRRPLRQGSSPLVFRDADDDRTEDVIDAGAADYNELVSRWRDGYRWMTSTGTLLRSASSDRGTRGPTRDYLAEPTDYLADAAAASSGKPLPDYL